MAEPAWGYLKSQLLYQGPTLLVQAVAILLALMNMRRARGAAVLTVIGVTIMVVTAGISVLAFAQFLQARVDGDAGGRGADTMLQAAGVVGSIGRAIGLGLLVAAIFVGRRAKPETERDDYRELTPKDSPRE